MYKWPGSPSPRAKPHQQADHNEFLAWKQSVADYSEMITWETTSASEQHIFNKISMLEENDYTEGVPEEDELHDLVGEVFAAVEERIEICRDGYPFQLNSVGTSLQSRPDPDNPQQLIYKYLLLATRLDMSENRTHASLDGTALFEELCAEAAGNYFGENSRHFVFGTANGMNNFQNKVDHLCESLGEGGKFRSHDQRAPTAKDDGLDIAVWTPFTDRRPGKLIGFGQCKTGTSYADSFTRLQPDAFCKNWFDSMPTVTPVPMFFVAEALLNEGWYQQSNYAGILLDRCRILEFCGNISDSLIQKLKSWTSAAAKSAGLPG